MKPFQRMLVCESMLARLDAALEKAEAEVECTREVDKQIQSNVLRLLAEQQRLEDGSKACFPRKSHFLHRSPNQIANDNPAQHSANAI